MDLLDLESPNNPMTSRVPHSNAETVTAAAGEVPATDWFAVCREGDVGAGQDGDFSSCSEEETESGVTESRPSWEGGRP